MAWHDQFRVQERKLVDVITRFQPLHFRELVIGMDQDMVRQQIRTSWTQEPLISLNLQSHCRCQQNKQLWNTFWSYVKDAVDSKGPSRS